MDVDRIGIVLAKVAELRFKLTNCIQKELANGDMEDAEADSRNNKAGPDVELEADYDDEAESLLNIRETLDSLEAQLSSLQALLQQQVYEKEVSLSEIRISQKKLLDKLKDYHGDHMDVVQEAIAFAGETVEDNTDLLLPPYPSWPSRSLVSNNEYIQQFPYTHKTTRNGVTSNPSRITSDKANKPELKGRLTKVKALIGVLAKAAITVVGFVSVLSLAGYEPTLKKRDNQMKLFGLFELQERGSTSKCPPGKVAVMENGEIRCLVKERVEIPFDPLIVDPDVKYGCG